MKIDGPFMCSEPTISYCPDYKSFKFIDENEGMKEAKAENKCRSEAGFRDSNSLPEEKRNDKADDNGLEESRRRKGSVEYELPELVVFLQESGYRFVNDVIEKKPQISQGKCLVENCELDHRIISCLLESEADGKIDTRAQNVVTMPSSLKETITKRYGSVNLMAEAKLDIDASDNISVDKSKKDVSHEFPLLVSEAQKVVLTSSMIPIAAEKNDDASQVSDNIVNIPKEVERRKSSSCDSDISFSTTSGTEELLLSPGNHQPDHDPARRVLSDAAESTGQTRQSFGEESSLFASGHFSGLVSHHGPSAPSFRSVSHRSNSSTTSSRSFAFPILASEWHGSPERMVKPDKRKPRKRGGRKCARFFCCKF